MIGSPRQLITGDVLTPGSPTRPERRSAGHETGADGRQAEDRHCSDVEWQRPGGTGPLRPVLDEGRHGERVHLPAEANGEGGWMGPSVLESGRSGSGIRKASGTSFPRGGCVQDPPARNPRSTAAPAARVVATEQLGRLRQADPSGREGRARTG